MAKQPTNNQIADVLKAIADLLETQDANSFRVRAYRDGARSIREHGEPVADYVRKNDAEKLKSLPNVGDGIAAVIGEYVSAGQSSLLQQLQAEVSPVDVFTQVPGIGQELARRIHDQLSIESLAELEEAAHDGRLASIEGFGERRIEGCETLWQVC